MGEGLVQGDREREGYLCDLEEEFVSEGGLQWVFL